MVVTCVMIVKLSAIFLTGRKIREASSYQTFYPKTPNSVDEKGTYNKRQHGFVEFGL